MSYVHAFYFFVYFFLPVPFEKFSFMIVYKAFIILIFLSDQLNWSLNIIKVFHGISLDSLPVKTFKEIDWSAPNGGFFLTIL